MKNRIEKKFAELKKQGRKALVTFVTAGDPHLKATPKIVLALEKAGADLVELGMPFSDPMADGPVIQKSSERALKAGTTLKAILRVVSQLRRQSQIPILLMGYYNPIFSYGLDKFFRDAKHAGVDGVLLVDLPPEEGEDARRMAHQQGIALVYLLAPTSDSERIDLINRKGSGFLYYVSMTGITGAKIQGQLKKQAALETLKKKARLPVCVGFGIKTPAQAREVSRLADGVVVGSALVDLFNRYPLARALPRLSQLVSSMARAVHS